MPVHDDAVDCLQAEFEAAEEALQAATSFDDHSILVPRFRALADRGHLGACTNLGYMLANGLGTETDYAEARRWLLLAANGGNAAAIHNLGVMLHNGMGVQADPAKAIEYCQAAAEKGHAGAQLTLGDAYETGELLGRDLSQAAVWFRAAAEQGEANAMFRLGRLLIAGGDGVDADFEEGFGWIKAAADTGDAEYQYHVGLFLEHNLWVPRSGTPREWYQKAADQGHEKATMRLARLYEGTDGEDEEHDDEAFEQAVRTAALADYYFIGYQTKTFTDVAIIASEPPAAAFAALFDQCSISYSSYTHPGNGMFTVIQFESASDKERADDFFGEFNFATRAAYGIPMPDIYEGAENPDLKICQRYQTIIHHFLSEGSGRPLHIPVGRDDSTGGTLHAEYTARGFRGLRRISYEQ